MLDFSLTEEQKALQQKARGFALKEILPLAHYCDTTEIRHQCCSERLMKRVS